MAGRGSNGAGAIDQRLLRDEASSITDAVARIDTVKLHAIGTSS